MGHIHAVFVCMNGTISAEIETAIVEHITGEKVPKTAHTHKKMAEKDKVRINDDSIGMMKVDNDNSSPLVLITKTPGFEGFRDMPSSSPLMKLGNKSGWNFQKEDYELARRLRADKEFKREWNDSTNNELRAKIRQIHAAHRNMKVQEIDETKIKPEITQIKGDFADNHYFGFDKISRKYLENAFKRVTGNIDKRTFEAHLQQYVDFDYLIPLDKKYSAFSATEKFGQI